MKEYFNNLKKVFSFYYKYTKYRIFILMILSALSGLLEGLGVSMLFPLLESLYNHDDDRSTFNLDLFNNFFEWLHIEQSTFALLVIFLSTFILKSSFKYFVGIYKTKLSTDMLKNIRLDFLKDFLDLDYKAYMNMDAGKVSNTFTLELEKTMSGFIYFCNYFVGLFTGLAFLVLVCFISLPFTLLIILVGVFYFFLFAKINQSINLFSKSIAQKNSIFNSLLIQLIQSFKYIKSTNSKDGIERKLELNIDQIRELKYKMDIRQSFVQAVQEPLVILLVIIVVYLNVVLFSTSVSSIITILLLFYRSLTYFLTSQLIWNNFVSQIGSTDSVIIMKSDLDVSHEKKSGNLKPVFEKEIKFENVNFGYSYKTLILKNIDVILPRNKTIAFVGKSGSGKSTLLNLLTGLLRPVNGKVLIDDVDLSTVDIKEWRKKIGYITQESVLFNDNLINNITMWDAHGDLKKEEFEKALKLANVEDFYDKNLDIEKPLGDRGITLSGGQRQRIAIARELYKSPELLILDEATSSLDSETENYISESISKLHGSLTIVIIAHRLSTIKKSDLVYVLDNGCVIERGSYEELSKNSNSKLSYFINTQSLG